MRSLHSQFKVAGFRLFTMVVVAALAGVLTPISFADDKPKAADATKAEPQPRKAVTPAEKSASPQMDMLRSLKGTWVADHNGPDGKPGNLVFEVTAAGSVVVEKMFPGTGHEMVNTYHMDGESVMVTHYCAQGVQPRMKLASTDGNTLKFEFLDCTNLSGPEEGHMASLEITVDGDKLIERWGYMKDGKIAGDPMTFELHRQQG